MVASGPHLDIHLDTALLSQIICIRLFLCCTIKNKTIDEEQMFSEDFVISFYFIFITIPGENERERKKDGGLSNNYTPVFVYYTSSWTIRVFVIVVITCLQPLLGPIISLIWSQLNFN